MGGLADREPRVHAQRLPTAKLSLSPLVSLHLPRPLILIPQSRFGREASGVGSVLGCASGEPKSDPQTEEEEGMWKRRRCSEMGWIGIRMVNWIPSSALFQLSGSVNGPRFSPHHLPGPSRVPGGQVQPVAVAQDRGVVAGGKVRKTLVMAVAKVRDPAR